MKGYEHKKKFINQHGAAMVEGAICLFLMVLLIGGLLDVFLIAWTTNMLQKATDEGVHLASVVAGFSEKAPSSTAYVQSREIVAQRVLDIIDQGVSVSSHDNNEKPLSRLSKFNFLTNSASGEIVANKVNSRITRDVLVLRPGDAAKSFDDEGEEVTIYHPTICPPGSDGNCATTKWKNTIAYKKEHSMAQHLLNNPIIVTASAKVSTLLGAFKDISVTATSASYREFPIAGSDARSELDPPFAPPTRGPGEEQCNTEAKKAECEAENKHYVGEPSCNCYEDLQCSENDDESPLTTTWDEYEKKVCLVDPANQVAGYESAYGAALDSEGKCSCVLSCATVARYLGRHGISLLISKRDNDEDPPIYETHEHPQIQEFLESFSCKGNEYKFIASANSLNHNGCGCRCNKDQEKIKCRNYEEELTFDEENCTCYLSKEHCTEEVQEITKQMCANFWGVGVDDLLSVEGEPEPSISTIMRALNSLPILSSPPDENSTQAEINQYNNAVNQISQILCPNEDKQNYLTCYRQPTPAQPAKFYKDYCYCPKPFAPAGGGGSGGTAPPSCTPDLIEKEKKICENWWSQVEPKWPELVDQTWRSPYALCSCLPPPNCPLALQKTVIKRCEDDGGTPMTTPGGQEVTSAGKEHWYDQKCFECKVESCDDNKIFQQRCADLKTMAGYSTHTSKEFCSCSAPCPQPIIKPEDCDEETEIYYIPESASQAGTSITINVNRVSQVATTETACAICKEKTCENYANDSEVKDFIINYCNAKLIDPNLGFNQYKQQNKSKIKGAIKIWVDKGCSPSCEGNTTCTSEIAAEIQRHVCEPGEVATLDTNCECVDPNT